MGITSSIQTVNMGNYILNMGNCILNISIFLVVLGIVSVNAGDSSNLADPVLFCDGCFALVSEVEKDMSLSKGQKLNTRIEKSLSGVCSTDKLRAYKFSPPTQVKTCNAILGKYRMGLTNILREEYRGGRASSVETLTRLFCAEATGACEGREVPTLQQKREREEAKDKAEAAKNKNALGSEKDEL